MRIDEIQAQINKTGFHDMNILDLKISFFGDEVEIIVDDDLNICWKIEFLSCYRVSYETDSKRRSIENVRKMGRRQLCYFGQEINVSQSDEKDYYKVTIDLSILDMEIECKDIKVSRLSKDNMKLLWQYR